MTITGDKQLLAELTGDAALAWGAFADANDVEVGSLLEALGPILGRSADHRDIDLAAALDEAIITAK